MFRWVIKQQLARGRRPAVVGQHGQVSTTVVDAWIKEVKAQGIRSVICLLEHRELEKYYKTLPAGLIARYRSKGLQVVHISAPNMRQPPLSDEHLKGVLKAYQRLDKPVLLACSAGIGRTGAAVRALKNG